MRVVKVDNVSYEALVDTGSAVCTMTETAVKRGPITVKTDTQRLTGFGGVVVPSLGTAHARIEVDEVYIDGVPICIVPDSTQTVDVLLGRTFTENENLAYLRVGNCLKFVWNDVLPYIDGVEDALQDSTAVTAKEDVEVPPRCVMLVEATLGAGEHAVQVPVENLGKEISRIRRDDKLGKINLEVAAIEAPEQEAIRVEQVSVEVGTKPEIVSRLVKLFNNYRDCFAFNLNELGCTSRITMDIVDSGQPVVSKPYRASLPERQQISEIIKEWREYGIVTDTTSSYASPVLLVKKKTGDARLVVDYRRLNQQTERKTYPIPTLEEQFENLGGCTLFSTLDLAHGYLQVPLTEEAKGKTAFITPDETGQFERMMFGLTNAPYEFCRLMNVVLGPLRNKIVMCYLDDMLVPAKDWNEMLERLTAVLEALRAANLTLKLRKCFFGMTRVEYLGFSLSGEGIRPGDDKVEAIRNFPVPKNVHDIRRFIGLTSYFRRFIPAYAIETKPLTDLTRKENTFVWKRDQDDAFRRMIELLCGRPVLRLYNPRATVTELHTDASAMGIAGILLQSDDAGELHPVYYISKKNSPAEARYHSSKLELMAIVWSVTKLRNFLIGLNFTVYTDCQALIYMNTQKSQNSQVARWFYLLQEFDYMVKYRKGSKMEHVDALSRAPTTEAVDTQAELDEIIEVLPLRIEDEILAFQRADPEIKRLVEILEKDLDDRTREEKADVVGYALESNRLVRRITEEGQEKWLFVVPKSMRKSIVVQCHELEGHFGVDRTIRKIRQTYWFARMRSYVKNHIRCCFQCIANKVPGGKQPGELHPIPPPRRPFERVHIDHTGPFPTTKRKNAFVFAIVCALTKFVKLYAVKDTKTVTALKKIEQLIAQYGLPKQIVSDRGTSFTSQTFQDYCRSKGIQHTLNSSRWPQANGQIERVNRTLVPAIACSTEAEDQWDNVIPHVERALNTAFNKTTGKTPYESLHGYLPIFHDDNLAQNVAKVLWKPPEEVQQEIRERVKKEQAKYKHRYDKKRFKGVTYDVGEVVFAKCAKTATGDSTKLQPRYSGPYIITERLPCDTYRVRYLDRDYSTTYHVAQLKPYSFHEENAGDSDSAGDPGSDDQGEGAVSEKEEDPELADSVVVQKAELSEVKGDADEKRGGASNHL